jgi:regulator of sirC expression with transglutaminase-like and TPR domain
MTITREEIKALIQLLDDPSKEVNMEVTRNLLDQGIEIVPELEAAWEGSMDTEHQERLINLIQEIQYRSTLKMLGDWVAGGAGDLLAGTYLIARFQYPDLRMEDLEKPLEKIIRDVWLELNNNLTALEKIRILNHIFYEVNGFRRNTTDFYSPRNSYINEVLEMRKGNPISLAVIYSVIAQRLGLPVYGVNLPKNYILAYRDEMVSGEGIGVSSEDILFYINPFNRGDVLGRREIEYFLKQQGIEPQPSYFQPCTNLDTVTRILHNLINAYRKAGYTSKAGQYEAIIGTLQTPK